YSHRNRGATGEHPVVAAPRNINGRGIMNVKLVSLCCIGLITWIGLGNIVHAQQASVPVGVWMGKDGPANVTLNIGANGTAVYHVSGAPAVVGRWTWSQTSATSGIITIHYHI